MKISECSHTIEIGVIGYEFDNAACLKEEKPNYDANWLTVKVEYAEEDYTAVFQDACVLTWELTDMADHLLKLMEDEETEWSSDFLEPYLSFEAEKKRNGFVFQIHFVCSAEQGDWKQISASQFLNREQLQDIYMELKGYQKSFPER